jgi:hypothetical protein
MVQDDESREVPDAVGERSRVDDLLALLDLPSGAAPRRGDRPEQT